MFISPRPGLQELSQNTCSDPSHRNSSVKGLLEGNSNLSNSDNEGVSKLPTLDTFRFSPYHDGLQLPFFTPQTYNTILLAPGLGPLFPCGDIDEQLQEAWKSFPKDTPPFLRLPPELHVRIFSFLNPIDSTCVSLVNKQIHAIHRPPTHLPLLTGSPYSDHPIPTPITCKHCAPVLYSPAHCELHFHLRNSIPKHLNFCAGCEKFTRCLEEVDGRYRDSEGDKRAFCKCGISYRRRYERGRKRLQTEKRDDNGRVWRVKTWFNESVQETSGTRRW